MKTFKKQLLCAIVACVTSVGAAADWKCPEFQVRVLFGLGIEICVPEEVASCFKMRNPQVWERGRQNLPGGCTWCIEICAKVDLVIWEDELCFRPVDCNEAYVQED